MNCEVCQKRAANVHETHTIIKDGGVTDRFERHLCEVCAGKKTEEQWAAEMEEAKAENQRRWERMREFGKEIRKELFESRLAIRESHRIRDAETYLDEKNKLVLTDVFSLRPEVDPMGALFGPEGAGKRHLVLEIKGIEVHVI